jgi:tight adherence protein B
MSPQAHGVLTAIVVLMLAIAATNVLAIWSRHRVRLRLIADDANPSLSLPNLPLQLGTITLILAILAGFVGLIADGAGLAVVSSFAVVCFHLGMQHRSRSVRVRTYNRQLVRVLDVIVLSLRSGAGLTGGIREAAAAHDGVVEADLREVVRLLDFGVAFEEALQIWATKSPFRSVHLTVACITLAHQTGGSTAQSIGAIRTTVRNALHAEASVHAHAAQARASAVLLATLPIVLSGPMIAFNHTARAFMLHSPVGLSFLFAGLVLDVVGLWWMSALIAKALS